ncbi:copper homeostasis protein CutC [Actinomadura harenae]|uniref:PF03932 family protein CutC n=1 Tax=Actinomadura harenae TaxID=2483351 RepID=A0A3M2LLI0_9ACTN|nr:copper homeostasis protein CutC [Actinomadura harenae]RMI38312.1 copper homeostasis protein CutC [Actinomadura harenae]
MSLTHEICIDSVAGAVAAEKAGAQRVELCSALFDGGLTPTLGTVRAAVAAVSSIRVHVIIRPRGGDFIFDEHEIAAMEDDVVLAREAGAHGIVIGVLTPEGEIDRAVTERLIAAAGGLPITFHRAFDMVADPFAALDTLIELGVDRVLTSGQDTTALEGAPLIADLIRHADGRIVIMPGGGITNRNVARVVAETGAREIHFAALAPEPSPAVHRNPYPYMGGELRRPEYERLVTSGSDISAVITAAG